MDVKAEVEGKAADRFRAYSAEKLTRKLTAEDHMKRAKEGKPAAKRHHRIQYDGEQVVVEGSVGTQGMVSISTPNGKTITRVVFYKGKPAEEVVVGMVEVNTTEHVSVELIEPVVPDPNKIEILED